MVKKSLRNLAVRLVLFGALVAVALVAPSQESRALDPADKEAIEQIVRDYLRAHPEVIQEAMDELRRRQEEQRLAELRKLIDAHSDALRNDPDSVVGGNPDGDVTVVEFFDYNCGYCKRSYPIVRKMLQDDDNIRLVYKEFPILGPVSLTASRAAIASRAQGKYKIFHNALMELRASLTEERLMQIAAEVGLDLDQLKEDMKAPEVDKIIRRNHQLAQTLQINGTPTFIIGDNLAPGYIEMGQFQSMVEEARTGCMTC
jgi:protein-disulfide isomerase